MWTLPIDRAIFRDLFKDLPGREAFPPVRVAESGDAYTLEFLAPGLTADDFTISHERQTLTVAGTRKAPVPEGYEVHRKERNDRSFSRSFGFSKPVDLDRAQARVADGKLTLVVPKNAVAAPRRIVVEG